MNFRFPMLGVSALIAVASFGALVACSSSSSSSSDAGTNGPCNENPWECGAGQTCWLKDATSFACLNSGAGKKGDECVNIQGSPTCADGLLCLQTQLNQPGHCLPYCDNTNTAHACATGEVCQEAIVQGTSLHFHVCTGGTISGNDAGTQDSGGSQDSGTTTDAAGD